MLELQLLTRPDLGCAAGVVGPCSRPLWLDPAAGRCVDDAGDDSAVGRHFADAHAWRRRISLLTHNYDSVVNVYAVASLKGGCRLVVKGLSAACGIVSWDSAAYTRS